MWPGVMFIAFGMVALYFGRNLQMGTTVRMGPGFVPHTTKCHNRVESRCGAVAAVKLVGHHQLSGTGRSASPQLRLHIPLIEPDMQISRIRLSDKTSRPRPRPAVLQVGQSHEPEVPVEV